MEKYEDLPIGIDLGTTFSCIGVYRNAAVEIIPNEKGDRTTPSVVSFLDGDIYVGEQTEYKRLKDPKNKIYAVKRIIGRNFDDEEVQEDIRAFSYKIVSDHLGRPVIEVNSNGIKRYSPEQIAAKILAKLKQSAESFLGQNIKKVVITVPAYFTERQKQATKNAGEIAGLEVIKIINEPTAASLAYGFGKYNNNFGKLLNKKNIFDEISPMTNRSAPTPIMEKKKDCQNILVFDLGGGTLDVTLLELEEGDITVKSHSGKMHLGGEDFDNQIMQYCINQFRYKTSIDLNKEEYLKQKTRLKEHCEKAKKKLSQQKEVEIEVESIAKGKDFYLKLSRAKFEDLCVAYGATIEAALQMGKYSEDVALLDVCPFSLGIAVVNRQDDKVEDMLMSKVIKRGSKLPCKKMEIFNPAEDYQKSILFRVYEGENQYVKNNYLLGKFRLVNLPMKPKNEVDFEVTFDLDEDSILTVTAVEKNNKSNCNSIVIKNDKGGLSKNEIEEAKKRQNDEYGSNLEPAMIIERNYKKEINKLYNEINTLTDPKEQYYTIIKLKNTIENFVNSFNKENMENETYKQKMYYYLTYLFNCYSSLLNFKNLISDEEKDDIISKVKNYLQNFEKTGTSYGSTLVKIFKDNENDIFGEFCIQILGYYSQRGTEYYANPFSNEKKNAKHYLEEALSIIRKYSVKEKIQNNSYLLDRFISIEDNINELLNILKAESIEKYCASFSKDMLIRENEFSTEEKKIDILDRFKDALAFLKNPRKRADKLLKAIYLANIVKIEFKMFNSNNYDALLKMIDDCISLKLDVPQGCGSRVEGPQLEWFNEICKIKQEIEKKKEQLKLNPKEDENKIKEELKYTLDEINFYYQKGKIDFFFYVLKYHKPIGLDDDYIFQTRGQLENKYYEDTKKFLKKMRRLYNPVRYKGDKEEEQKRHAIMQEIQKLLNEFE